MNDPVIQLADRLPGGEWSSFGVVQEEGMMARRAIHARAVWEREGGVPARIKCILIRGQSAGPDTQELVNLARLKRIAHRLDTARTQVTPLVRLLRVDLVDNLGLIIAMEEVTPLTNLVASRSLSPSQVADMLGQLGATTGNWVHYDICPANTGRDRRGRFVFIDPESFYPIGPNGKAVITYPAAKWRLPDVHNNRLALADPTGGYDSTLVRKKHNAELLLVACELFLGHQEVTPLSEDYLHEWLEASTCSDAIKAILEASLQTLCRGDDPDVREVARQLRGLGGVAANPGRARKPVEHLRSSDIVGEAWGDLEQARRALRAERLQGQALARYREVLLGLAKATPRDKRIWEELLVVAMGYENDPRLAMSLLDEALCHFPGDARFVADRRLVMMCRGEL